MPSDTNNLLAEYPVTIALPVQWGDQDSFGHVNNTVYFRWFESARIAYCMRLGLSGKAEAIGPILASITCNFRRQLTFPDTVHIGARVSRIGRTSLTMEHLAISERTGSVVADGPSVLVIFDYDAGKPHAVPGKIRESIEALEGKSFGPPAS